MTTIAFCQSSFGRRSVEQEFRAEHDAARRAGFETVLIDHDRARLGDGDNVARHLPESANPSTAVYRGWMLPPDGYATLYHALDRRGLRLVNDPRQYVFCHHLPNALAALGEATPQTWSVPLDPRSPAPVDELLDLAGTGPVIVKDYVKSEKHMWDDRVLHPGRSRPRGGAAGCGKLRPRTRGRPRGRAGAAAVRAAAGRRAAGCWVACQSRPSGERSGSTAACCCGARTTRCRRT